MATKGKSYGNKLYPQSVKESSNLLTRVEPIITPGLLKSRYLHLVPQLDTYTDDELQQEITLAMNEVELLLNVPIYSVQKKEKFPYDYSMLNNNFHFKTSTRPIQSVESVTVMSTNGVVVYRFPNEWMEMALAYRGQINFLPLLTTFSDKTVSGTGEATGAAIFIQAMGYNRFISSYFEMEYTAGLSNKEGQVPVVVNDLIGMTAATEILSALQNQYIYGSQSLSQDGISQSSGINRAPFNERIQMLTERKERILARLKMLFFSKYYVGNI